MTTVTVEGVVVRNDHALVIKRDTGAWTAPGGGLNPDETFEDSVTRHVRRQTGLNVSIERLTGVYQHVRRGILTVVFRCASQEGEPEPNEEASGVQWMTKTGLITDMEHAHSKRILDAFDNQPHYRNHDGINVLPGSMG